jgi:hypothetical protein
MHWELGPFSAADVRCWSRTARRLVLELRSDPVTVPGIVNPDLLDAWSRLIDRWAVEANADVTFRWSAHINDDQVEFLLHGLEQCLRAGHLGRYLTDDEIRRNSDFMVHLVDSMIGALRVEGRHCEHFADEMRELLAAGDG